MIEYHHRTPLIGSFLLGINKSNNMNKPNIWVNRAIKIGLLAAIPLIAFFSPSSGILVEGSLSTINGGNTLNLNQDNNIIYSSSQAFLLGTNPTSVPIISQKVTVTAYSSTPDQTDDTPFITASGKVVDDGIVASNFLTFGTKLRFPQLFGNKIFVVEDRMHQRYSSNRVDIWFPDRESAENFGIQTTIMEILE